MANNDPLPYLTTDLPGICGVLKQEPEDFVVEEIPVYQPSGEGEHLFLWVEKRGVAAEQLSRHIAQTLSLKPIDVGVAGLKDRHAVTRQFVSVPAKSCPNPSVLETDDIRILQADQHTNKLKTGHLRGNRFEIVLRDTHADAVKLAEPIAKRISALGFPNYYGEQRFGRDGENVSLGIQLLRGEKTADDIPRPRRKFLLRFALSAVQSDLFNQALANRLTDQLIDRVLEGDVMQVVTTGGVFLVDDQPAEQTRFDDGETMTTGPMFGPKMRQPTGEPAERETQVLQAAGLDETFFRRFAKLTPGTRRPYLIRPQDLECEAIENGCRFRFSLPSGVYATTLLREFQKTPC
ncbi:tRNA pseudouridine(13) synthase TruD [Thalassoroseus pseudoceratinae]|uniref:tRNA pseudouridine(13) synthase TruD n=1 Tax=Thalassoroseus pseudoceratinae TaxID=2713176 RepID=UPI00141E25F7|nr:tRNA pseudouridine(13) synthase TruD [Thalassoroseus pseudoceratinae]